MMRDNLHPERARMSTRERMSSVDTAWLRMDRPNNLMMIVGVMVFAGRLDYDRLLATVRARLLPYPRFHRRVAFDASGAFWEDDPDFELETHVLRTALPGEGGKAELQKLVAEMVSQPLNPSKPLWQFQLVDNYLGGSAMIVRIHHCIADGIALIGVMQSLTDESADAPIESGAGATQIGKKARARKSEGSLWDPVLAPLESAFAATVKWSGSLLSKSVDIWNNPQQAADLARLSAAVANDVGEIALMANDTPTRFKGKPGTVKRVAWSDPMSLVEIKAVGKALGCSVNDVMLACVAGALREYLVACGDAVDGVEVRAMVPVNLRPPGREHQLGNHFGLVPLLLPVGIAHPITRVFEVRRRMEKLKGSYQPVLAMGLLGVLGVCPKTVQSQILDVLARRASAVMTNVPGPQKQLWLCGEKLAEQMFWVPQSGDIGIGVSILSYNGQVQMGVITDKRFVPDPEKIVARFEPEFEHLLLLLLMEPWDGERSTDEIERILSGQAAAPAEAPPKKAPARRKQPAASAAEAPQAGESAPTATPHRIPKRFR